MASWDILILSALRPHLPPPLFDTLQTIISQAMDAYDNISLLVSDLLSDPSAALLSSFLDPQRIIPALMSIIILYFSILSLYHTATFALRITFGLIKWGLIFTLVAIIAMVAGGVVSLGDIVRLLTDERFRQSSRDSLHDLRAASGRASSGKPGIRDTWDKHRQWRADQRADPPVEEFSDVAQKIFKQVWESGEKVVQEQGGWSSLLFGNRAQGEGEGKKAGSRDSDKTSAKGKAHVR